MALHASKWQPPVPISQQAHRRWDQQAAHQGRVDDNGEGHAQAERLDQDHIGGGKAGADDNDDDSRAGNNAPAALQSQRHSTRIVARLPECLLHTREQEYFIIHGEAK